MEHRLSLDGTLAMRIQVDSSWMFNTQILILTVYRFLSLRVSESSAARKCVQGANPPPVQRSGSHTLRDDPLRSFRSFFRRMRLESFKIETSAKSKNRWKRIRQMNRWERSKFKFVDCLAVLSEIRAFSHFLLKFPLKHSIWNGWESQLRCLWDGFWKRLATIAQQGKTKERKNLDSKVWRLLSCLLVEGFHSSLVTFSMARKVCYSNLDERLIEKL